MASSRARTFALAAATALTATGLTVGLGTATATAADTAQCATSATQSFNVAGTYTLAKEIVGPSTVAPGGTVTFRTTVTGPGALVQEITDIHPAGFELTKAVEDVRFLGSGQKTADVTAKVTKDGLARTVSHSGAGWTTAGSAYAALETSYRVPADATPGEVLNTGAAMDLALANGEKTADPIGVCVTIREPNPVESVTGSLEGLGLGALTAGSSTVSGASSDPAGSVGDALDALDLGGILGDVVGAVVKETVGS